MEAQLPLTAQRRKPKSTAPAAVAAGKEDRKW